MRQTEDVCTASGFAFVQVDHLDRDGDGNDDHLDLGEDGDDDDLDHEKDDGDVDEDGEKLNLVVDGCNNASTLPLIKDPGDELE